MYSHFSLDDRFIKIIKLLFLSSNSFSTGLWAIFRSMFFNLTKKLKLENLQDDNNVSTLHFLMQMRELQTINTRKLGFIKQLDKGQILFFSLSFTYFTYSTALTLLTLRYLSKRLGKLTFQALALCQTVRANRQNVSYPYLSQ